MVTLITEKLQDQTLEEISPTETVHFFICAPFRVMWHILSTHINAMKFQKDISVHMSFLIMFI